MRKTAISLTFAILALLALTGCDRGKTRKILLPNVSGKAGEVIVVMDKGDWEGNLGNTTRSILAQDCPYLPQREPLYTLVNVLPSGFMDLFKYHRNIVFFDLDPETTEQKVIYRTDVWADTQCIVQVSASCADSASAVFLRDGDKIISFIEQAERQRVIENTLQYEEKSVAPAVEAVIGGKIHCPTGYRVKSKTSNFIWIEDARQYTQQGIFAYRYPAQENDNFTLNNIVAMRNEFLRHHVPGMFENSYMITGTYPDPELTFLKYKGRDFAQVRGWWEVYNDYMGGPFVSHSFYSRDGKEIIVLEAYVYAAKYDKRQYLRQVESMLYSFEWSDQPSEEQ